MGRINGTQKEKRFQFSVPFEGKPEVIVNVIPSGEKNKGAIEAFHEFETSEEMWKVLQDEISDGRDLPENLQEELSEMESYINKATWEVLNLIKNSLYQYELADNLFSHKGTYWSEDRINWKEVPRIFFFSVERLYFLPLNENNAKNIQEYLNDNSKPFFTFALKYLHKAKKERHPHYIWINATIAAELAIKEFLTQKEERITNLLMELPSPPIYKLYGRILESYIGERSPKVKALSEGQNKRNDLVHRPKEVEISWEEVRKYVRDVEIAIYHLLNSLYPDNSLITMFCERELMLARCPNCNRFNDGEDKRCFHCSSTLKNN